MDCIFVIRENEVLKHQLRKYVSAVQMLKRDDADHSYEAQLYENKLVQVNAKCSTAIAVCSNKNVYQTIICSCFENEFIIQIFA